MLCNETLTTSILFISYDFSISKWSFWRFTLLIRMNFQISPLPLPRGKFSYRKKSPRVKSPKKPPGKKYPPEGKISPSDSLGKIFPPQIPQGKNFPQGGNGCFPQGKLSLINFPQGKNPLDSGTGPYNPTRV